MTMHIRHRGSWTGRAASVAVQLLGQWRCPWSGCRPDPVQRIERCSRSFILQQRQGLAERPSRGCTGRRQGPQTGKRTRSVFCRVLVLLFGLGGIDDYLNAGAGADHQTEAGARRRNPGHESDRNQSPKNERDDDRPANEAADRDTFKMRSVQHMGPPVSEDVSQIRCQRQ